MVQEFIGGSEFEFGVMRTHTLLPSHFDSDACFSGRRAEGLRP
jgi:hypothetical protein